MGSCVKVRVNEKEVEEVDKFKYMDVMTSAGDDLGKKGPIAYWGGEKYGGRWESCGSKT